MKLNRDDLIIIKSGLGWKLGEATTSQYRTKEYKRLQYLYNYWDDNQILKNQKIVECLEKYQKKIKNNPNKYDEMLETKSKFEGIWLSDLIETILKGKELQSVCGSVCEQK